MKILFLILFGFITLNAKPFEDELKSYLDSKLGFYEKYEYQIVRMPKGFKRIEISDEKQFRLAKNYAYVPVKTYDEKNNPSATFITLNVKLYRTVYVSTQKINAGETLFQTMFESRLQDIASLDGGFIDEHDLSLYRSKVLIKEETILTRELVELIPIINKGEKVVVHAGKNGVDITIEAVTRQNANAGDVISIQANNKIFKARVIDKYNLTLVE
jgi:flagella basal body P-ring formation protein FlgA